MTDDVSVLTNDGTPSPTVLHSIWALSTQTSSAWTSNSPNRILVACLVESSTRLAMLAVDNALFLPSNQMTCLIMKFWNSVYVRATVESSHLHMLHSSPDSS